MKEKDKISYLFEEAVNFFNAGDYPQAIQAWEEILKYDPGNAQATQGIKVASDRLGDSPAPAAAKPAPAAPAAPVASAGDGFDMGDDLGDPFSDAQAAAPSGGLEFDVGEASAPAASAGDDLDAWGLPTEEAPPVAAEPQDGATMVMGPGSSGAADSLPPVDDIGELIEEDEAAATGPSGGDEFGWSDEPAAPPTPATPSDEFGDLDDIGDIGDIGDLGGMGDLEELDLPTPDVPGAGFEERAEPDTIPPGGAGDGGDLDFDPGTGGDEISLGQPSPLPLTDDDDDIEDLGEDLGLEPDTTSIPLAGSVPLPTIPLEAPRRSSALALPLLGIMGVVIVGIVLYFGWGTLAALIGWGPKENGGLTATGGEATGGSTTGGGLQTSPVLIACQKAMTGWMQRSVDAAATDLETCLSTGKRPDGLSPSDWREIQNVVAPEVAWLKDQPTALQVGYMNAVYDKFCTDDYRTAIVELQNLQMQYPQHSEHFRPWLARIQFNSGVTALQANTPDEAIYNFEQANRFSPDQQTRELLVYAQRWENQMITKDYKTFVGGLAFRKPGCP